MGDPQTSLLEFPCDFPLKVIGKDGDDFIGMITAIVRRHVPGIDDLAFTSRPSGGGTYIAVSVTFIAESKAQVDALYLDLSQSDRVLMVL